MKIVRIRFGEEERFGVLEGFDPETGGGTVMLCSGDPLAGVLAPMGEAVPLNEARLLSPCRPTKIIGIGLNYYDHIRGQGLEVPEEPYIVHRPLTTLNRPGGGVPHPFPEHFLQFEGELIVVIGRECSRVSAEEAPDYVLGYTIGNDITDKFYFKRDRHFGIAKAIDGQCPIGPFIETEYSPKSKWIKTWVNGRLRQDGTTDDMVFSVEELIAYLSQFMTLLPGDVILTGSPAGVGKLEIGDTVRVEIEGLGCLENRIEGIAR